MAFTDFAEKCFRAAGVCLKQKIPFALTFLPGNDEPQFAATKSVPSRLNDLTFSRNGFVYNLFASREVAPLFIPEELSPDDVATVAGIDRCDVAPWPLSTEYGEYCRRVGEVVGLLCQTKGKTVISRAISASAYGVDWIAVCRDLFVMFPDTYRFIYYTPQTGAWLGASPETLLNYDSENRRLDTMALAGTRPCGVREPWDAKNIREHDFVTEYIVSRLCEHGIKPVVSTAKNVRYGLVEHLCHNISVHNVEQKKVLSLLAALSPTPALAGYPLEDALCQISQAEDYPRICYGGYVGNISNGKLHCYVNLRSVHFNSERYCIFTGGGITSDSIPDQEWTETEAKSKRLLQIINSNDCNHRNKQS